MNNFHLDYILSVVLENIVNSSLDDSVKVMIGNENVYLEREDYEQLRSHVFSRFTSASVKVDRTFDQIKTEAI